MNKPAPKRPQPSGAKNWIGFLVLGFGVMCVLAVGMLIFSQKQGMPLPGRQNTAAVPDPVQTPNQNQPAGVTTNTLDTRQTPRETTNALAQSLSQMREVPENMVQEKNTAKISEAAVAGNWEVNFGNGQGVLQLSDGVYRLIMQKNDGSRQRFYSNGRYEIEADYYLVFAPDLSILPPDDGEIYRALVLNQVAMRVEMRDKYMIWTKPSPQAPVLSPAIHPILQYGADNLVVWERF